MAVEIIVAFVAGLAVGVFFGIVMVACYRGGVEDGFTAMFGRREGDNNEG